MSFGASSGPSDLTAKQTPSQAIPAVFASFDETTSAFGTLVADPKNNTPFLKGSALDIYTKDGTGHAYQFVMVLQGTNLSARWVSIQRTYKRIDKLKLTYSPLTQNSNSLAVNALRRAGVPLAASCVFVFVPGAFTDLP